MRANEGVLGGVGRELALVIYEDECVLTRACIPSPIGKFKRMT